MRVSTALLLCCFVLLFLGCQDHVVEPEAASNPDRSASAGLSATEDASKAVLNFTAPLSGKQEVPPVDTRATGVAKFQLSKDGTALKYRLNVANIEGVTQSHIHCGAAGVNGPVIVFLFGFVAGGVTVNGTLAEGTITADDVIARPDSEACPGGIADFDDLLEKMKSGDTYVNVHTLANPPGEIRGQIDRGNGVR